MFRQNRINRPPLAAATTRSHNRLRRSPTGSTKRRYCWPYGMDNQATARAARQTRFTRGGGKGGRSDHQTRRTRSFRELKTTKRLCLPEIHPCSSASRAPFPTRVTRADQMNGCRTTAAFDGWHSRCTHEVPDGHLYWRLQQITAARQLSREKELTHGALARHRPPGNEVRSSRGYPQQDARKPGVAAFWARHRRKRYRITSIRTACPGVAARDRRR